MTVTVTVSLPSGLELRVGELAQARVRIDGLEEADGLLDARPIAWESSDPAVASISESGLVTGVAPGTTVIRATVDRVVGAVTLNVSAVVIPISTAQEASLLGLANGQRFVLLGPTKEFDCEVRL